MVAREMRIASDFYRQTMTLLVLPPEVKPWEREKMTLTCSLLATIRKLASPVSKVQVSCFASACEYSKSEHCLKFLVMAHSKPRLPSRCTGARDAKTQNIA